MQCLTGSQKQPAAPVYFQFDSTTVANFMPFGAAIAFLSFLQLPIGPVDTATFCATEPPATVLSAADILALTMPPIAYASGAYSRLADFIQQQAFATYCQCSGVSGSAYETWILSQHPLWYLKLGEAVGVSPYADATGNGWFEVNSGGVNGQAALMTGSPATAVHVPGSNKFVESATLAGGYFQGTTDRSIEFWAKIAAAPAGVAGVSDTSLATKQFVRIDMRPSGKVLLVATDSANVQIVSADSAVSLADGLVHQYDLVMNHAAHTLTLYIDAV